MSFNTPSKENVSREVKMMPDEGRHDVVITEAEARQTRKGDDMLVLTYRIDTGPDTGHTVKDYIVHKDEGKLFWTKMACIADACSWDWNDASTIQSFAAQIPLGELRMSVEIEYSYSINAWHDGTNKWDYNSKSLVETEKCSTKDWLNVTKEEYEQWDSDDKNVNAGVVGGFDFASIYQPPQSDSEIPTPDQNDEGQQLETVAEDDDLPF